MKAITCCEYGAPEVLHVTELEKPVPGEGEILVRVHATDVTFGDRMARNFKNVSPRRFHMPAPFWLFARLAFGWRKPRNKILGSEFAGEVEAVGAAVTRFRPGDRVLGYRGARMGGYAEYLCMPADGIVAQLPGELTYAQAASIPYGAMNALNVLRKAGVERGQSILINGASGAIGSAAVQLAKTHFGAIVTGVCSTPHLDFVRSLGADKVIDYTREDFTQNGETYDAIIDILGKSSFARTKTSLKPGGVHLYVSFKMKQLAQMLWTSIRGGKRVRCVVLPERAEDLRLVAALVGAGKLVAVIDRSFPLEQASEAHRYAEQARGGAGHVAITM